MSYQYPYAWKEILPSRLSVSQLKKTGEEETFSEKTLLYEEPAFEDDEPVTEAAPSGSQQGTAIHKVLSLLDFDRMDAEFRLDLGYEGAEHGRTVHGAR